MLNFPISDATPPEHDAAQPAAADIVIVGGGIIGVCTALFAARKGLRAVLVEKGRIAGEQSSRNWGWIRKQGRDPSEIPLMIEAAQLWQDLAAQVDTDIGLRQCGLLYTARDAAALAGFAAWMTHAEAHGLDSRLVTAAEMKALLPEAAQSWAGGLFTPSDMRAEPWVAVPALGRLAVAEGATLIEGCAARGIETRGGRVSGLVTERGTIKTDAVVVAGGAWSSLFLRNAGVSIPQLSVRAGVVAVDAAAMGYIGGGADRKLAFRRRADGGYSLAEGSYHELLLGPDAFRHATRYTTQLRHNPFGTHYKLAAPSGYPDGWRTKRRWALDEQSPFEALRVLNPTPNVPRLKRLAQSFETMFPALGPVRPKAMWGGMIDTLPDLVPLVDQIESVPGLTVATGMSGHGFGIGPAMGRIVADLATGDTAGHDMQRFRFGRFSDGSPVDLGPAI